MALLSRNRSVLILAVLFCLGTVGFFLLGRASRRERVVLLPFPSQKTKTQPRFVLLVKGWAWRAHTLLFGSPKVVTLSGRAINLHQAFKSSELSLPISDFSGTNGVR